ncbi:MAG: hypothetical protein NTW19_08230 [Planctomycetota bacterium]|nr:hypothetical protein [Planctomycetota bacterium]
MIGVALGMAAALASFAGRPGFLFARTMFPYSFSAIHMFPSLANNTFMLYLALFQYPAYGLAVAIQPRGKSKRAFLPIAAVHVGAVVVELLS